MRLLLRRCSPPRLSTRSRPVQAAEAALIPFARPVAVAHFPKRCSRKIWRQGRPDVDTCEAIAGALPLRERFTPDAVNDSGAQKKPTPQHETETQTEALNDESSQ
jgi:hypothetical protein